MFVTNKRIIPFILIISTILLLFSLSGVSALSYTIDNTNTTAQIQSVIDTDVDPTLEINLKNGNYNLDTINIKRNATIIGESKDGVVITGTGTLFNINASNVKIINLTILNFNTAISANKGDLTISNNYMDTTNSSISINTTAGNNLNRISIENNTIVSAVQTTTYGAVYINVPTNAGVIVDIAFLNNNITATTNAMGVRVNAVGSSSNLTFSNNNITGTYGVYLLQTAATTPI